MNEVLARLASDARGAWLPPRRVGPRTEVNSGQQAGLVSTAWMQLAVAQQAQARMPPEFGALHAALADPALEGDAADWDTLYRAALARLRLTAGAAAAAQHAGVRANVLASVLALEQLHGILAQERRRHQRIEHELREAHAALALARTELATTRAGEQRARHRASHDDLTTLPNRRFFRERLDDALTSPQTAVAVLYIDLDGFKAINDDRGHHSGDEVLRIVAARLARAVRREDMVCRVGGDEFACMRVDAIDREHLRQLACKLFDAVAAPLQVGALQFSVRASIGIAVGPGDGAKPQQLLERADAAMYRAKRQQTRYAFFDGHDG